MGVQVQKILQINSIYLKYWQLFFLWYVFARILEWGWKRNWVVRSGKAKTLGKRGEYPLHFKNRNRITYIAFSIAVLLINYSNINNFVSCFNRFHISILLPSIFTGYFFSRTCTIMQISSLQSPIDSALPSHHPNACLHLDDVNTLSPSTLSILNTFGNDIFEWS